MEIKTNRWAAKPVSKAYEPREEIQWLIKGLVREGSLNQWYGKWGHKKTFVALSAAICVAAGIDWAGLETMQCPVLWTDEEMGENDLLERVKAGIEGEGVSKDIPLYYTSFAGFNFHIALSEHIAILKKNIIETGARLVFIDAYVDVMTGSDENDVSDNQKVLGELLKLCRELNVAIVLLHHANKEGGSRGSSAISAGTDATVKILSESGTTIIKLESEKVRFGRPFRQTVEFRYENDESDTLISYSLNSQEFNTSAGKIEKEIIKYAKEHNGEIVVAEYLSTMPEAMRKSYRNAIGRLDGKNKKILIKNEEKSTTKHVVYTLSMNIPEEVPWFENKA